MPRKILLITMLLIMMCTIALCASAQQKIQPLDLKLGLWEVTTTSAMSGQMPMPPEALAKLTPEQRARMEERMKANSSAQEKPTTRKECITKEKLSKENAFGEERKFCTRTVTTSTGSKLEIKIQCAENGMKSDGMLRIEAVNFETVKGSMNMAMSGGERTMNMNSNFTGKWVSAACGEVQ